MRSADRLNAPSYTRILHPDWRKMGTLIFLLEEVLTYESYLDGYIDGKAIDELDYRILLSQEFVIV
jgi:hypothetical protein